MLHPLRGTPNPVVNTTGRYVSTATALERFLRYCQFDPLTGCVLWTGGTAAGRGNSARYGSFWYDRARWFAHRWAAKHIHGLSIDGLHVDHCCPLDRAGPDLLKPNPLCVQHVQAVDPHRNGELRWERQRWLLVQRGFEPAPDGYDEAGLARAVPFHAPPSWLRLDAGVMGADKADCPF